MAQTANALEPQREPMLVTPNGVLVPAEDMQREMEARRHSEHLRARAEQTLPPTVLAKGLTYDVMAHSDVLLTCSGTATLEAAIFGTPMVILYRGSKLMEMEYKLRGINKKIRFIGLPNILADRAIVPELIQDAATPRGHCRSCPRPAQRSSTTRQRSPRGLAGGARQPGNARRQRTHRTTGSGTCATGVRT